jgi:hypothetical protein
MSLVAAAKRVGVHTVVTERGKRGMKTTEWLRIDLLEHCYGKGLGVQKAKSMTELDARIMRAVDCCKGEFGYILSLAQYSLREANNERAEACRIAALKRPRPIEIAQLLKSASQWLSMCGIYQNMHSLEVALRDGVASDYRPVFKGNE